MRIPPINDHDFWSDLFAIFILGMRKVLRGLMGW